MEELCVSINIFDGQSSMNKISQLAITMKSNINKLCLVVIITEGTDAPNFTVLSYCIILRYHFIIIV